MIINEFNKEIKCRECGKIFHDKLSPDNRMHRRYIITAFKQLAGHIMRSRNHKNKKWAKAFLLGANVGTGLFGDFKSSWGR